MQRFLIMLYSVLLLPVTVANGDPAVADAKRPTVAEAKFSNNVTQNSTEAAHQRYLEAKALIVDGYADDRARAENLLIDAIRLDSSTPEPYVELVRYTLWQVANGMQDASSMYRAAELAHIANDLSTTRPIGQYLVCELLVATGQPDAAKKLFETVSKAYPNHVDTFAFEARFFSQKSPSRSLDAAQKALSFGHPMDDLSISIVDAITNLSDKNAVGENIERFAKIYPDRWLWHRAAAKYVEERRFDKAETAYQNAIRLGNGFESRLQLGVLAYTNLKQPTKAVQYLGDLRNKLLAKPDVKLENLSLVDAHLAIALLEQNKSAEATTIATEALSYGVSNPSVANALYSEFDSRSKADLLKKPLEKLVTLNPLAEYAHIMLGNLASNRSDFTAALSHFSHAILLAPERDDLYSARGHAWYFTAQYKEALTDFEQAIRYRPSQASHYYNRACMLVLLGRNRDAVRDLKAALNLNQNLIDLAKKDTDLNALRKDDTIKTELAALGL